MEETPVHHGQQLQLVQKKSGIQVTVLAKKMGIATRTIYLHFEKEQLPSDLLAKYGRVLKHDFRKDFPEIAVYIGSENLSIVRDDQDGYGMDNPTVELLNEIDKWKSLAYTHLETANKNLEEAMKWKGLYYDVIIANKKS